MKSVTKEQKWNKKYKQINLNYELYPDDLIKDSFLILTKKEIKELQDNTIRRIKLWNRKYKPRGYATYGGYGTEWNPNQHQRRNWKF